MLAPFKVRIILLLSHLYSTISQKPLFAHSFCLLPQIYTMSRMGDAMRVIGKTFGGRHYFSFSYCLVFDDSFLSFFFSSAYSPFHRVIVIGGISLHSEVMNAACQIAHARAADAATIAAAIPSDGRASPSAAPAFNFTSSSIPAIACISTTIHSHMARALFWDSEFRCCVLWPQALVNTKFSFVAAGIL
jgi:hypothetical protein